MLGKVKKEDPRLQNQSLEIKLPVIYLQL